MLSPNGSPPSSSSPPAALRASKSSGATGEGGLATKGCGRVHGLLENLLPLQLLSYCLDIRYTAIARHIPVGLLRPKGDRTAGDAPKPANNTSATGVATSVPTAPASATNCVLAMRLWHACHTPARSPRGGSCGESAPHVQTCDVDQLNGQIKKKGNPSGMQSRERQMGCESLFARNQRGIIPALALAKVPQPRPAFEPSIALHTF